MFLRPNQSVFLPLADVAREAKQLEIRRIARSAFGNRENVVDLQFGFLSTAGTSSALRIKQLCYVLDSAFAAVFKFASASINFACTAMQCGAFWVCGLPFPKQAANLKPVIPSPFSVVCAPLFWIFLAPSLIVRANFVRVSGAPKSGVCSHLGSVGSFPIARGGVVTRGPVRIVVKSFGECCGSFDPIAFDTNASVSHALCDMTMLARLARKIAWGAGSKCFLPRNLFHPSLQSAQAGSIYTC